MEISLVVIVVVVVIIIIIIIIIIGSSSSIVVVVIGVVISTSRPTSIAFANRRLLGWFRLDFRSVRSGAWDAWQRTRGETMDRSRSGSERG